MMVWVNQGMAQTPPPGCYRIALATATPTGTERHASMHI